MYQVNSSGLPYLGPAARLFVYLPPVPLLSRPRWCAMKKWCLTLSAFALLAGYRPEAAFAQSNAPVSNIGDKVRAIFAIKCAGCHGPDLAKPKGRFGYVLDLHKIAENPEMVIPQRPDESELWVLVDRNEMPPSDSPHGSLNQQQKEVIKAWIAA